MSPAPIEAALAYAARGWPVFPLRPRGKVPLIAKRDGGNGCHDATTDVSTVKRWWTEHPDANVGLAAGPAFWVMDVDLPDGADVLPDLQHRFGRLPPTVRQRTGGLGWQLFFAPDPRIRNGVRVLPGLDTRGTGGYVVAPPSVHPDTGYRYRWLAGPDEAAIVAAPEWLIALLEPVEPPPPAPPPRRPGGGHDLDRYAEAALASACEKVAGAAPGTQEPTLNAEAYGIGTLVGGGVIPHDLAAAELLAAGLRMRAQVGRRPWTHREVAWRVDRALASGSRNPRVPEARS